MPLERLPARSAATHVEPIPTNGATTWSPSLEYIRIRRSASFTGKTAPCLRCLSCLGDETSFHTLRLSSVHSRAVNPLKVLARWYSASRLLSRFGSEECTYYPFVSMTTMLAIRAD